MFSEERGSKVEGKRRKGKRVCLSAVWAWVTELDSRRVLRKVGRRWRREETVESDSKSLKKKLAKNSSQRDNAFNLHPLTFLLLH